MAPTAQVFKGEGVCIPTDLNQSGYITRQVVVWVYGDGTAEVMFRQAEGDRWSPGSVLQQDK